MKRIVAIASVLLMLTLAACKADNSKAATSDTTADSASTAAMDIESLDKYITLCKYENIEIDWNATANSQYLEEALSSYTAEKTEVTTRGIKNGDTANIDYKGYKDGVAFSGGTAEGYDLKIGSGSFIDGFESGLIGVKTGETVSLNLTFPEAYDSAELAGQDVVFKVKVNSIYTEKYAAEDEKAAKNSAFGKALVNTVVEGSKYKTLPTAEINYYVDIFNTMYTNVAKNSGYDSLEKYLTANGTTLENFNSIAEQNAQSQLKNDIANVAIAKKEGLMPTEAEYNSALSSYAAANSCTESELLENNSKEIITLAIIEENVEGFLKTKSKLS